MELKELQAEFDIYEGMLREGNRVQHIKDNYDTCSVCKNVADLHSMCSKFNEKASATFFIEAMKDYLTKYENGSSLQK